MKNQSFKQRDVEDYVRYIKIASLETKTRDQRKWLENNKNTWEEIRWNLNKRELSKFVNQVIIQVANNKDALLFIISGPLEDLMALSPSEIDDELKDIAKKVRLSLGSLSKT